MEKLSINLCSSCVNMFSRNLRSFRWTEKCFSSSSNIVNCHQSSSGLKMSPDVHSVHRHTESMSTKFVPNYDDSRRHTVVFNNPFYGLCLRKTTTSGYTFANNSNKETIELLLKANYSTMLQSVKLYSTNSSSGSQPPLPRPPKLGADRSPISWKTLLVVAGLGCLITFGVQYVKSEKQMSMFTSLRQRMEKARSRLLGKAKLGGDWSLIDHHGNRRSSTDFRGQWLLIYFGFTHCPDVCPDEIEKIVNVINKTDADKDMPKIQPMIITVDPERDTPEALKEYCSEFSPRLLGFTGGADEIQQVTHAFRVYFSPGPKDVDSDYIVDHSIISYLVNPEGQFVDYFGQNKTVSEMYTSIQFHIKTYLKKQI